MTDYTLNKDVPLTSVQNEVVQQYGLSYKLIFEKPPQLKKSSINLLRSLNSLTHGKVLEYNYHKRVATIQCNSTGLIYINRPERIIDYCRCDICVAKRISHSTKEAMQRPTVYSKVNSENKSSSHKMRFLNNKHKGSTLVPTKTEDFIMNFLLSLGFEWNNKITFTGGYYKPDFIHKDKKLIIELDGSYHKSPSQIINDTSRDRFFEGLGYKTYRFTNSYVLNHTKYFKMIVLDLLKGGDALYDRLYIK